jgi:hypothetical protein
MTGSEAWKAEALKLGGQSLVDKIVEMADGIHVLLQAADKNDDRMRDAEVAIQKLYKGFPSSDVDGHRRAHEAMIERTSEIRRLRVAIQEKTISGLIWSGIVGIAVLIWIGIVTSIGLDIKGIPK